MQLSRNYFRNAYVQTPLLVRPCSPLIRVLMYLALLLSGIACDDVSCPNGTMEVNAHCVPAVDSGTMSSAITAAGNGPVAGGDDGSDGRNIMSGALRRIQLPRRVPLEQRRMHRMHDGWPCSNPV